MAAHKNGRFPPNSQKVIFRDKNAILGASYICSLKKTEPPETY